MIPLWLTLARIGDNCPQASEGSYSPLQRATWERVASYFYGMYATPLSASGTSEMPLTYAHGLTYKGVPVPDPKRDSALKRIAELENALEERSNELAKWFTEAMARGKEITALESKLAAAERIIESWKREESDWKATEAKLHTKVGNLVVERDTWVEEYGVACDKVDTLEAENSRLRIELAESANQVHAMALTAENARAPGEQEKHKSEGAAIREDAGVRTASAQSTPSDPPSRAEAWTEEQQQSAASVVLAAMHGPL
jgi:hypothetical protein